MNDHPSGKTSADDDIPVSRAPQQPHAVDDIRLQISGRGFTTRSGRPVVLRGVGLGGWMNMENFITGYPATETLQRAALLAVLGAERYRPLLRPLPRRASSPTTTPRFSPRSGSTRVRHPGQLPPLRGRHAPVRAQRGRVPALDRAIERCARHGIYTIIDLHALPGCQNQHWHSDNPTHRALFWQHRHFQDRVVHLWEALAAPLPRQPVGGRLQPDQRAGRPERRGHRAVLPTGWCDAVRAIDPDHIVFLEGNRYSMDFYMFGEPWPNAVYTVHDYALPGHRRRRDYPGVSRGRYVDSDVLEETFLTRTELHARDRRRRSGSASSARSTRATRSATRCATRSSPTSSSIYTAARCELGDLDLQGHRPAGTRVRLAGLSRICSASGQCSTRRPGWASTRGARPTPACVIFWRRSRRRSGRSSRDSIRSRSARDRGSTASSATCCLPSRSSTTSRDAFRASDPTRPPRSPTLSDSRPA